MSKIIESYKERYLNGNILFEGKLKRVYKNISDSGLLYLIDGGRYIKDYKLKRDKTFFEGVIYPFRNYEISDISEDELAKNYFKPQMQSKKDIKKDDRIYIARDTKTKKELARGLTHTDLANKMGCTQQQITYKHRKYLNGIKDPDWEVISVCAE